MPGPYFQIYEDKKVLPLVRKDETKRTTLGFDFFDSHSTQHVWHLSRLATYLLAHYVRSSAFSDIDYVLETICLPSLSILNLNKSLSKISH